MNAQYWFFDLDGTLADTDCDIRLAWKTALKGLGLERPDFDEKFVTGPPIDGVIRVLFPERYSPAFVLEARKAFACAYDACGFPNTREYPFVMDVLRRLRAAGAELFIVTNKRYAGALAIADKFGWHGLFTGIYAGDMYAEDPSIGVLRKDALLRRVLSERTIDPAKAVLVGDTALDFDAARVNGVKSVAVAWGYGTPAERATADLTIESPLDLNTIDIQKGETK